MTRALVAAAVLLAGCGGRTWTCTPDVPCPAGVRAEGLAVGTSERVAREIDLSLAYWGADRGALDGWRIVYDAHLWPDAGLTSHADRTMTVLLVSADCPEVSPLSHEIGHAVIGDPAHHDPRWREFDRIWRDALSAPECAGFIQANDYWNREEG